MDSVGNAEKTKEKEAFKTTVTFINFSINSLNILSSYYYLTTYWFFTFSP